MSDWIYRSSNVNGIPMLIVQRITTEWTKASRGGSGAAARNAVPDALPVPAPADPASDRLLHDVQFPEGEQFDGQASMTPLSSQVHIRLEPVVLRVTSQLVATRFVWSWHHCGAPERDSHDLFQLSPGQWGRFTCNGRFGAESSCGREWGYHKTIFNIAFVKQFDSHLFVTTTPSADESRLAVLR